jgi:AcrR family transcriptional regulator
VDQPGGSSDRLPTSAGWSDATAPVRSGSRSRKNTGDGKASTRTAILDAAERLYAEQGVQAVSNRQIGAAAGRGDTSAVGYYFESKADLVRALLRRFSARVDRLREKMLAQIGDSEDLRDWIECLVYPTTDMMEAHGTPSWHARFGAQIIADPVLREIGVEEATSPTLTRSLQGLQHCLPDLPPDVLRERLTIASHVLVHMCAERERALAEGLPLQRATWDDSATVIVDALFGLFTAPMSQPAGRSTSDRRDDVSD